MTPAKARERTLRGHYKATSNAKRSTKMASSLYVAGGAVETLEN